MAIFLFGVIPAVVIFCFILALLLLQLEGSGAKPQPIPKFEDLDLVKRSAA